MVKKLAAKWKVTKESPTIFNCDATTYRLCRFFDAHVFLSFRGGVTRDSQKTTKLDYIGDRKSRPFFFLSRSLSRTANSVDLRSLLSDLENRNSSLFTSHRWAPIVGFLGSWRDWKGSAA